ncbi:MAG TPA: PEP-CTERM sorting domain-containing protein [Phycisphaerae bacterium]|nr:PEP-CTERM sorting domain-containing protein [Phycisphaerae bacterium]
MHLHGYWLLEGVSQVSLIVSAETRLRESSWLEMEVSVRNVLGGFLMLLVLASCGKAGTVTGSYEGVSPSLSISYSTDSGAEWATTKAGRYHFNVTASESGPFTVGGSFDAYCIDVYQRFGKPLTTWTVMELEAAPIPDHAMGSVKAEQLSWLLSTVSDVGSEVDFQLAIWEIVTESSTSYNLDDGSFRIKDLSAERTARLSGWFTALDDASLDGVSDSIIVLGSDSNQDYAVVEISTTPVPEPTTMLLLCLGAGAILKRRRRK